MTFACQAWSAHETSLSLRSYPYRHANKGKRGLCTQIYFCCGADGPQDTPERTS